MSRVFQAGHWLTADFARNIGDESEGDDGGVPLQKVVIQQLVNYLTESL